MSIHVLTDARFYINGYAISADGNEVAFTRTPETKEFTAFTNTTRIYKPGLFGGSYKYSGFQQEGTGLVGDILRQQFGVGGVPILASAEGANAGDRCTFLNSYSNTYEPVSGKIGEPFMFTISGLPHGGTPILEGTILEDGKTTRVASNPGPFFNVGAVGSAQRAYAIVQVLSINAGNLQIIIQSASDSGGTNLTNSIIFNAQTAVGGLFAVPVAGPITNAFWRANWTLAGGATAVNVVVGFAIL